MGKPWGPEIWRPRQESSNTTGDTKQSKPNRGRQVPRNRLAGTGRLLVASRGLMTTMTMEIGMLVLLMSSLTAGCGEFGWGGVGCRGRR